MSAAAKWSAGADGIGRESLDVMGDGARPALFEGKMLKRVSTCPYHPKYQGIRRPSGKEPCPRCMAIFMVTSRPVDRRREYLIEESKL
jgi:hypothetical protein